MNTEDIARICHEANRAYCLTLGDTSQVPWDEAPDWQRQSVLDGVLNAQRGAAVDPKFIVYGGVATEPVEVSPKTSHENWLRHKAAEGWTYGEKKDPIAKTHPCMVPYDQLPPEQRTKNELFVAIVRALTQSQTNIEVEDV